MRRLFFGSQFYVQFQKTVTSFMQFQKTVTSFMCSFKKLSRVSCSFKKLSLVSCLVSKKNVTFVCSSGETIRHFAKRKTRLQVVILTACKKTFFRVSKCWNSVHFSFFGGFFWTFFFFKLFLKFAILNRLFMYYFFPFFPNLHYYSDISQTQMKLRAVSLKLFETIWNYLQLS